MKQHSLIRNLDDARADIPIVAMTANAFEEDRQKALESGMNAHVSKPVDMNMLFAVTTQILKNESESRYGRAVYGAAGRGKYKKKFCVHPGMGMCGVWKWKKESSTEILCG
ncbi:MAG: response regulator [Blautia sp.]